MTFHGRDAPLGPVGRPWSGSRLLAATLALATLGVAGVVMLSDRAPGALQRVSGRLDASERVSARAIGQATPPSDTMVHLIAWGAVMVLVGLAAWSWRSLSVAAIGVLMVSTLMELAQEPLTSTRNTELSDLAANVVGITAGLVVVAAWSLGWRLLAGPGPSSAPERHR